MLGKREPEVYGKKTLNDIDKLLINLDKNNNIIVDCFQSNIEGEIIDKIQQACGMIHGIIINPAAYTHTSVAIHDALKAVDLPAVEVHISNIGAREEFRGESLTAPACIATIAGLGVDGYEWALRSLVKLHNTVV